MERGISGGVYDIHTFILAARSRLIKQRCQILLRRTVDNTEAEEIYQ